MPSFQSRETSERGRLQVPGWPPRLHGPVPRCLPWDVFSIFPRGGFILEPHGRLSPGSRLPFARARADVRSSGWRRERRPFRGLAGAAGCGWNWRFGKIRHPNFSLLHLTASTLPGDASRGVSRRPLLACSTQCSEIFWRFFFLLFLFVPLSSQGNISVLTRVSLFRPGKQRGKPDALVPRARVDLQSSSLSSVPLAPTSRVLLTQSPQSPAFRGRRSVSPSFAA